MNMLQSALLRLGLPILALAVNHAYADIPVGRWSQACALVDTTIYCYGGSGGTYTNGSPHIYNDMYSLDLMSTVITSNLDKSWKEVNMTSNTQPSYNWEMAIASSTEQGVFVMDGGSGRQDGQPLAHQTWIYRPSNNSWEYADNAASPLQMHQEPMVTVNGTKMYRWGGFAEMQVGVPEPNNGTVWKDNRMFIFDLLSNSWSVVAPQFSSNFPIRTGHSATLSPDGNSIYYFGGLQVIQDANGTVHGPVVDFMNVLVYNTITTNFQLIRGTGDKPSNRTLHTTTLLPGKSILLFGGADPTDLTPIVNDPVHEITVDDSNPNSPTFTFKQRSLPKDGAVNVVQRWGHSSVLVTDKQNNSYVFILLGRGADNQPQADFHILSIPDFTWAGPNFSVASPNANANNDSLSGGAIAGIVVGVVAGVAIIAGLIAFCCIRRRRQQYSAASQNFPAYDSAGTQASQPPPSYAGEYPGRVSVAASKPDAPTSAAERITMTPVVKPDGA